MAVDDARHVLDVRTELAVGDAVRVADRTTGDGVLAADGANLRHCVPPCERRILRPPSTHSWIRIAQLSGPASCFRRDVVSVLWSLLQSDVPREPSTQIGYKT